MLPITIVVIKGLAPKKWMEMLSVMDYDKTGESLATKNVNNMHKKDIPHYPVKIKNNVSSQYLCVEVFQPVKSK